MERVTPEKQSDQRIFAPALVPFLMVILMWAVHLIGLELDIRLSKYGLYPRTLHGLLGIFTIPFLHGSFSHLINNSAPMLILGWMLFKFYRSLAFRTLIGIWLISGIWLWISGRDSFHIGASGLVYGLASFLFLSGWLRREKRVAALSFVVVFLYGGLWWGVLPVDPGISWEGHLWGALAGFSLAIYYRKKGPQRPKYQWELEDEEEPEADVSLEETPTPGHEEVTYIYTFKPTSPPKNDGDSKIT